VLDKFKNFAGRSFRSLKTLQGGSSYFKKLYRELFDRFKNFAGRCLVNLKTLQGGP